MKFLVFKKKMCKMYLFICHCDGDYSYWYDCLFFGHYCLLNNRISVFHFFDHWIVMFFLFFFVAMSHFTLHFVCRFCWFVFFICQTSQCVIFFFCFVVMFFRFYVFLFFFILCLLLYLFCCLFSFVIFSLPLWSIKRLSILILFWFFFVLFWNFVCKNWVLKIHWICLFFLIVFGMMLLRCCSIMCHWLYPKDSNFDNVDIFLFSINWVETVKPLNFVLLNFEHGS